MLTVERYQYILNELSTKGKVMTADLSKTLDVSTTTIRTDLNTLEKDKLIKKVHGGAVSLKPFSIPNIPIEKKENQDDLTSFIFKTREFVNQEEKNKISKEALKFIKDGQCIIMDASSTCLSLAKRLDVFSSLTVVTNGIYTMLALKDLQNVNVIFVGGMVTKNSGSTEGLLGKNLLDNINADIAFISSRGFTIDNGLTDFNVYEADLKKSMLGRSKRTIALLDYSKFGVISTAGFCKSEEIELIITDASVDVNALKECEASGIKVLVAK